jgi:putative heme-binding domain-containing protein
VIKATLFLLAGIVAWGQATSDDLAQGERLFGSQCAYCHGPRGDGGRGANLAVPRLRHAPDEATLVQVISRGIPGTGMPGSALSARQARQVAALVRTLGRVETEALAGDAARGRRVYEGKGACARCHTIAGRGGGLGPDLSDAGARSSPRYLREALLDPEKEVPSGFLQVRVATADGRRITGVRVNEDTFSLQLRDLSDQTHSFWKRELTEIHKDQGKSPMPSYRSLLAPAEVEDLVAYLVSLQ